jgi:probable addiction module antidote protein
LSIRWKGVRQNGSPTGWIVSETTKLMKWLRDFEEGHMRKLKTRIFDASEYLTSEKHMAAYLEEALSEGDSRLVTEALGAIAKARGMARIAKATGLRRESLYKALSTDGNPEFATILKVVKALGIRLHAETALAAV